MSDRIHVDFDQLDLLRRTLDVIAKGLRNIQERFDSLIKWLKTQWSGAAELAFEIAQQMWDRAMSELVGALQKIAVTVGQASKAYRAVEKANTAAW